MRNKVLDKSYNVECQSLGGSRYIMALDILEVVDNRIRFYI